MSDFFVFSLIFGSISKYLYILISFSQDYFHLIKNSGRAISLIENKYFVKLNILIYLQSFAKYNWNLLGFTESFDLK